jgi:glycosyltransferase involved in cell wall biosynthesis
MTSDVVGGVWNYSLELARGLAHHGIATTIAVMGPGPSVADVKAAADIAGVEIVAGDYRLEWMETPWADLAAAGRWLLDLERRVQPDVVHINGYAHAALSWRAPVVAVGHSCLISWSVATGTRLDPKQLDPYMHVARRGLHAADWVVTPTAAMLDALQRHYGRLPRASVIANARDASRFSPRTKEPFVFSGGRVWDAAKNIGTLCAIAPRLSWPVVVAGDGACDGVVHAGRLAEGDLADHLGRASIFALPARYEPFGLLALEAALSGCALVVGDIPSLREVWGSAVDFVPPDDPDALRNAIERLIAWPVRRLERAATARARAMLFSPARMAAAYLDVYRQVLAVNDATRAVRCAS